MVSYPQFVDKLLINRYKSSNVKDMLNFCCGYLIDNFKLCTKFVDKYVNSVDKKEFFPVLRSYIL